MKRFILLTLVAVLWMPSLAQNIDSFFKQLTDKYAEEEGFSASMITSDMFDLYLKKKKVDEPSPVYEALKNLDKILVVSQSDFSSLPTSGVAENKDSGSEELYETISAHYKKSNYTLFKTEKRLNEDVKVYLQKNQDKINSIALITHTPASTNLIELQGDIDLTTVAQLSQALNLHGLENLYKINGSNKFITGNYLGPGNYFSQERIEEMVDRQRELAERQRTLTLEQRKKIEEQARIQAEKQKEMAEKYRQMAEKYQRQPIFLNYPGDSTIYYLNGKKVDAQTIKKLDSSEIKSIELSKAEKKGDKTIIRFKTK